MIELQFIEREGEAPSEPIPRTTRQSAGRARRREGEAPSEPISSMARQSAGYAQCPGRARLRPSRFHAWHGNPPGTRNAPGGRGSVQADFTHGAAIRRVRNAPGGRGSVRADFTHGAAIRRAVQTSWSCNLASRKKPAHGVRIDPLHPTIVFVTVCTKDRNPWLATAENHKTLCAIWGEASVWLVGRYVLMPDHVHLFAAPGRLEIPLDHWVRYWKSQFSRTRYRIGQEWQANHWDTRLRSGESYDEKWFYVRENPVRAGLVKRFQDWPYQGELNVLHWV
jgi:putative transposase